MFKKRPTKYDVIDFAEAVVKLAGESILRKIPTAQYETRMLDLINDFLRKFGK